MRAKGLSRSATGALETRCQCRRRSRPEWGQLRIWLLSWPRRSSRTRSGAGLWSALRTTRLCCARRRGSPGGLADRARHGSRLKAAAAAATTARFNSARCGSRHARAMWWGDARLMRRPSTQEHVHCDGGSVQFVAARPSESQPCRGRKPLGCALALSCWGPWTCSVFRVGRCLAPASLRTGGSPCQSVLIIKKGVSVGAHDVLVFQKPTTRSPTVSILRDVFTGPLVPVRMRSASVARAVICLRAIVYYLWIDSPLRQMVRFVRAPMSVRALSTTSQPTFPPEHWAPPIDRRPCGSSRVLGKGCDKAEGMRVHRERARTPPPHGKGHARSGGPWERWRVCAPRPPAPATSLEI